MEIFARKLTEKNLLNSREEETFVIFIGLDPTIVLLSLMFQDST